MSLNAHDDNASTWRHIHMYVDGTDGYVDSCTITPRLEGYYSHTTHVSHVIAPAIMERNSEVPAFTSYTMYLRLNFKRKY